MFNVWLKLTALSCRSCLSVGFDAMWQPSVLPLVLFYIAANVLALFCLGAMARFDFLYPNLYRTGIDHPQQSIEVALSITALLLVQKTSAAATVLANVVPQLQLVFRFFEANRLS